MSWTFKRKGLQIYSITTIVGPTQAEGETDTHPSIWGKCLGHRQSRNVGERETELGLGRV